MSHIYSDLLLPFQSIILEVCCSQMKQQFSYDLNYKSVFLSLFFCSWSYIWLLPPSRCLLITTFSCCNCFMQGFPNYTDWNQLKSCNIVYPQLHKIYSLFKTSTHLPSLPLPHLIAFCSNVFSSPLLLNFPILSFIQTSLHFSVIKWVTTVGFLAIYPKFITLVSKDPL